MLRDIQRAYEKRHLERRRAKGKAWRAANPDKVRERNLKAKYGMTPADFNALLESQGNGCAICSRTDPGPKGWCVDHDHFTGSVRGILCTRCNQSLGLNGDTVENIAETAARQTAYLKLHEDRERSKVTSAPGL